LEIVGKSEEYDKKNNFFLDPGKGQNARNIFGKKKEIDGE